MPVQMIELEEVQMVEASDDALEALIGLRGFGTQPWNNNAWC